MKTRYNIAIILLIILSHFGYGQVQLEPVCAESEHAYGVRDGLPNSRYMWFIDHSQGEIITGESTDTVVIRWGYHTGEVDMEVLEITSSGCSNVPSQASFEIVAPLVDLGYEAHAICDGESITLDPGGYYGETASIMWHNGSEDYTYTANQSEEIWVHVIDSMGCSRYDTMSLFVNELPTVNLGDDDIYHCDKTTPHVLEPEGEFASYSWRISSKPNSETTSYYYDVYPAQNGIYDTLWLAVTDYNNCPAADTILIMPCDIQSLFENMNNTITPNNDGSNDLWVIDHMEIRSFENAVLEIFDRWGRLVYRTERVFEEPWDGTSGGRELPMDAYYFVLDLNIYNTEPIVGTVNLIR